MSTIHYTADELAKLCLCSLIQGGMQTYRIIDLQDQMEGLELKHAWAVDTTIGRLVTYAAEFSEANTKAYNVRYPTDVATAVTAEELRPIILGWAKNHGHFGFLSWIRGLVRGGGLKYAMLLEYNLDGCATIGALRFCLWNVEARCHWLSLQVDDLVA